MADIEEQYREQVRLEYEQAKAQLLARLDINGKKLCARGRVYRALSMAGQFTGKQLDAFKTKFNELADQAEALINDYNEKAKAYLAFCTFSDTKPEWGELPDCNCEGCKLYE